MSHPRRKCKLADTTHKNIDLTQYSQIIITTINNTVSGKNPRVYPTYFSTDVLTPCQAIAIGKALSKLPELHCLGKTVTIFRLFDGKTYDSEESVIPLKSTKSPKGGRRK